MQNNNPEEDKSIAEVTTDAIEQGFDNADAQWKSLAMEELGALCLIKETLTANDLRPRLQRFTRKTHDNRAVAGVMRSGVAKGWIEKSGEAIVSRVGHASPLQVWRSKIYRKPVQEAQQSTLFAQVPPSMREYLKKTA